jgi:hypothetical protein
MSGANAVTDAFGVARVGSWSLTPGANALTATVQDPGPILGNPVTFTAAGASAAYHIECDSSRRFRRHAGRCSPTPRVGEKR